MAQVDRFTGLTGNVAIKTPCRAATTANITLSGEQTIDGIACVTDDRVLVKDQTDTTENGIYVVDSGSWERAADFDGNLDVVKGTLVLVVSGTVNGPSLWQVTSSDPITIDTSTISFAIRANTLAGVSAFVLTLLDDTTASAFLITLGIGTNSQALLFLGMPASSGSMGAPVNFSFAPPSVNAGALTMSVKGADANAPSATNPVWFPFRSSTATSGAINWRSLTSALSLTISSTSTLGHNSAVKQYIYWYALDVSGTVELAASSKFFGWHGIVSTTAEGGAGAADSGTVMYSQTARSNVPFNCIGMTEDTQATAGTWATAPSQVNLAPFSFPLISFSAHKNGTDQTGIVTATDTAVTFGTEVYDNGGLFASSAWTPPPGLVDIQASLNYAATVDQATFYVYLFKNGSVYKYNVFQASGTGILSIPLAVSDECNGTDVYSIQTHQTSGGNRTISGSTMGTYFMGRWSPQRS